MIRSRTYIATPPGETIREQLQDRGMTQKEFAVRMDLSEKHVSKLINGDVQLTPEMAVRLEMVLGVPAAFWNRLEAIYREKLIKAMEENEMESDIAFVRQFPYVEMAKLGWVTTTAIISERVVCLRQFFEVARLVLIEQPGIAPVAYRRQAVSEKTDYALLAWAQQAKREARKIETQKIDLARLESMLPEFRKMTMLPPEEFCPRLEEMLASCGVAIIFLPHIKGTFLHGATFYDGKKIVLGLTVRGKYADQFWFSFFHEIAHILHGDIGKTEGVTQADEDAADAFARQTLVPDDAFMLFVREGDYSSDAIYAFSMEQQVAAGVIVGRLQHEKHILHSMHNQIRQKYAIT